MQRWIAFVWIGGIICLYLSAGLWLSLVVDWVRSWRPRAQRQSETRTNPASILILIAAAVGAYLMARISGPGLGKLWLADVCLAAGSLLYWAATLRNTAHWQRVKVWRATRKDSYLHLVLLTGAVLFSAPFYMMVSTSLKVEKQVFANPPVWIPHPFVPHNYPRTLEFLEKALPVGTYHGLLFVANTLTIAGLSLLGTLLTASMVAYAFARLRWPGRDLLFYVLLSTMMVPGAVTMIPVFLIFRSLGWIDTLRPLWVPAFFGGAFNVFLLRQFFMSLPVELEDAARIDGCSYWTTYWRILLPQIKPALAALAIMQFMGAWNDFMGPLIYISSPEKLPGSYALQLFQSAHGGEWTLLMCAATLWTLPVIILFFFTQRQFIEGITLTGIKG